MSKENNLITLLNTDTPQLSADNSKIPSIPSNINTPKLENIFYKSSTNQIYGNEKLYKM